MTYQLFLRTTAYNRYQTAEAQMSETYEVATDIATFQTQVEADKASDAIVAMNFSGMPPADPFARHVHIGTQVIKLY